MPIRTATPDDFEAVQALYRQLLEFEYKIDKTINPDFSSEKLGVEYINDITNLNDGHFAIVYEDDNKLLGYASLRDVLSSEYCHRQGVKIAEIQTISVDQNHRDKGIGRQLIEECIKVAKRNGYTRLKIVAMCNNDRARFLYNDCGFQERNITLEMEL